MKRTNYKIWTFKENGLLRKIFPTMLSTLIAVRMKRTKHSIYNQAHKLGLKKDPAWRHELNRSIGKRMSNHPAMKKNRFRKGVRLPHQALPGGKRFIEGGKATRFKKGQKPINTLFDGAIVTRWEHTGHKGKKRPLQFIRVKGKWEYLHRHIWKKHHGPIPKGKRVMFKDRNCMNCRLSNLVLRSAKEAGKIWATYDETIALRLSAVKGGKGLRDEKLMQRLLKQPDLLNAKRRQLQLHNQIKKCA